MKPVGRTRPHVRRILCCTTKPREKANLAHFFHWRFSLISKSRARARERLCILQTFALLQCAACDTVFVAAKPPIYGPLRKSWLNSTLRRTHTRKLRKGFLVKRPFINMSPLGGTSALAAEMNFFYTNEQRPQRWCCPPNRPHHLLTSLSSEKPLS